MKITKRQLRRIIREEKARILKEARLDDVHNVIVNVDGTERSGASFTYYGVGQLQDVVDGQILNPQDLRRLADKIEMDMAAQPGAEIVLDID